jgi:hypothetical protein
MSRILALVVIGSDTRTNQNLRVSRLKMARRSTYGPEVGNDPKI